MSNQKPILLSGIQPSGQLTIGHYMGAIANWVKMQQEYDCLFMLADLHTLTVRQDPEQLLERCYDVLAWYIAFGIDPEKNVLFAQSHVPAHTRLAWILSCFTYTGELSRMTQFKDKSKQHETNINAGLFNYPVLMAADILVYGAHKVPVGDDQKQHMELTRDVALRFNSLYGDILTIPEPFIPAQGARIMSLQEPTRKMSKSDANEQNYIALLDSADVIRNKLKRAVTDSGNEVRYDVAAKPGVANLLVLFSLVTDQSIAQLEQTYQSAGYGKFKSDLAEAIVEYLRPVQERYYALRADLDKLQHILEIGAQAARNRAQSVLSKVHNALGLIPEV